MSSSDSIDAPSDIPEPPEHSATGVDPAIAEAAANLPVRPPSGPDPVPQTAGQAIRADLRAVISIPTLRALMIGSGVITGSLTALGYWGSTDMYCGHPVRT